MAIKAAAVAVVLGLGTTFGATQTMAQPIYFFGDESPIYDSGPMRGMSTRQIMGVVRAAGMRPIAQPRRVGHNYIVRSLDRRGVVKRVVIDADLGEIVHVRAARGPGGRGPDEGVRVLGPDAGPPLWSEGPPPRPNARIPGGHPPARAEHQKKNNVASIPSPLPRPATAEQPPAHEPDTESLPKAETPVTIPPSATTEGEAKPDATASLPSAPAAAPEAPKAEVPKPAPAPRSATVMPAKPPLPARRPAAAPQPAAAKPESAVKESKPEETPRVVLPGGPAAVKEKDETTASNSKSSKPEAQAPKADDKPVEKTPAKTTIVPAQSYE